MRCSTSSRFHFFRCGSGGSSLASVQHSSSERALYLDARPLIWANPGHPLIDVLSKNHHILLLIHASSAKRPLFRLNGEIYLFAMILFCGYCAAGRPNFPMDRAISIEMNFRLWQQTPHRKRETKKWLARDNYWKHGKLAVPFLEPRNFHYGCRDTPVVP
jgi:hypothetical protein